MSWPKAKMKPERLLFVPSVSARSTMMTMTCMLTFFWLLVSPCWPLPLDQSQIDTMLDPIAMSDYDQESKVVKDRSIFNTPVKPSSKPKCAPGVARGQNGACGVQLDQQFLFDTLRNLNLTRKPTPGRGSPPRRRMTTTTPVPTTIMTTPLPTTTEEPPTTTFEPFTEGSGLSDPLVLSESEESDDESTTLVDEAQVVEDMTNGHGRPESVPVGHESKGSTQSAVTVSVTVRPDQTDLIRDDDEDDNVDMITAAATTTVRNPYVLASPTYAHPQSGLVQEGDDPVWPSVISTGDTVHLPTPTTQVERDPFKLPELKAAPTINSPVPSAQPKAVLLQENTTIGQILESERQGLVPWVPTVPNDTVTTKQQRPFDTHSPPSSIVAFPSALNNEHEDAPVTNSPGGALAGRVIFKEVPEQPVVHHRHRHQQHQELITRTSTTTTPKPPPRVIFPELELDVTYGEEEEDESSIPQRIRSPVTGGGQPVPTQTPNHQLPLTQHQHQMISAADRNAWRPASAIPHLNNGHHRQNSRLSTVHFPVVPNRQPHRLPSNNNQGLSTSSHNLRHHNVNKYFDYEYIAFTGQNPSN